MTTVKNDLDVVEVAKDLYKRGMNVFPIPRIEEVKAWNKAYPKHQFDVTRKPSYFHKPLMSRRLHMCSEACFNGDGVHLHRPLRPDTTFEALFGEGEYYPKPNIACMCGKTSGNLLSLDCDDESVYGQVGDQLRKRNISTWAYRSGRGGGQYLVRIEEGEIPSQVLKTEYGKIDILGARHYIVVPPSVHPNSTMYMWETENPLYLPPFEGPPVLSIQKFDWLGIDTEKDLQFKLVDPTEFGLPEWASRLSQRSIDFLLHGASDGERNNRLFAAACDMNGNDIEMTVAQVYLEEACRLCTPPYTQDSSSTIRSAYNGERIGARAFSTSNRVQRQLEAAYNFAMAFDWKGKCGRTAQTDKNVFLSILEQATAVNKKRISLSVRQASGMANINKETAAFALRRLCGQDYVVNKNLKKSPLAAEPLLREITPSDRRSISWSFFEAKVYEFTKIVLKLVDQIDEDSSFNLEMVQNEKPLRGIQMDIFTPRRRSAWRIWHFIEANPGSSRSTIMNATGINRSGTTKWLRWLIEHGLIETDPNGLYQAHQLSEENLQALAAKLGSLGYSERRQQRYRWESEINLNRLLAKKRQKWASNMELFT
jgi:hypothetical protein